MWFLYIHTDYKGNIQRLAVVQYSFDWKKHKIDIQPHGNYKIEPREIEDHMKKVQSCVVTSTAECSPKGDSENDSFHHLSISTMAQSMLQNTWKKAENLSHVMCWLSDNKARLVKSNSPHPHTVTTLKSNNNIIMGCHLSQNYLHIDV